MLCRNFTKAVNCVHRVANPGVGWRWSSATPLSATAWADTVAHVQAKLELMQPAVESAKATEARLASDLMQPDVWDNQQAATRLAAEHHAASTLAAHYSQAVDELQRLDELRALALGEGEPELVGECDEDASALSKRVHKLFISTLLSGPADSNACVLEIQAGAGGDDAQDWAAMLLHMYERWAASRDFTVTELDRSPGAMAGIRSGSVVVEGWNAFGLLKVEAGVHRLVRRSPFDPKNARHTSFARVCVFPKPADGDDDVELDMADVRIDTFRSRGAGGQSVNTTDSAVRIVHEPSGITVSCQRERSQHMNKSVALAVLRGKLKAAQLAEQGKMHAEYVASIGPNEWGSQIRSYTLHPYEMIKDHRTGNTVDGTGVTLMLADGSGLDRFIEEALARHETSTFG